MSVKVDKDSNKAFYNCTLKLKVADSAKRVFQWRTFKIHGRYTSWGMTVYTLASIKLSCERMLSFFTLQARQEFLLGCGSPTFMLHPQKSRLSRLPFVNSLNCWWISSKGQESKESKWFVSLSFLGIIELLAISEISL